MHRKTWEGGSNHRLGRWERVWAWILPEALRGVGPATLPSGDAVWVGHRPVSFPPPCAEWVFSLLRTRHAPFWQDQSPEAWWDKQLFFSNPRKCPECKELDMKKELSCTPLRTGLKLAPFRFLISQVSSTKVAGSPWNKALLLHHSHQLGFLLFAPF